MDSGSFTGMPKEWKSVLNGSNITESDYENNPQAVIDVINFYTGAAAANTTSNEDSPNDSAQTRPPIPSSNFSHSYGGKENSPGIASMYHHRHNLDQESRYKQQQQQKQQQQEFQRKQSQDNYHSKARLPNVETGLERMQIKQKQQPIAASPVSPSPAAATTASSSPTTNKKIILKGKRTSAMNSEEILRCLSKLLEKKWIRNVQI